MVTCFLLIGPVSLTSTMRMPIHLTIVYMAFVTWAGHLAKDGDGARLALDRLKLVFDARANSRVAIERQFSTVIQLYPTTVLGKGPLG